MRLQNNHPDFFSNLYHSWWHDSDAASQERSLRALFRKFMSGWFWAPQNHRGAKVEPDIHLRMHQRRTYGLGFKTSFRGNWKRPKAKFWSCFRGLGPSKRKVWTRKGCQLKPSLLTMNLPETAMLPEPNMGRKKLPKKRFLGFSVCLPLKLFPNNTLQSKTKTLVTGTAKTNKTKHWPQASEQAPRNWKWKQLKEAQRLEQLR